MFNSNLFSKGIRQSIITIVGNFLGSFIAGIALLFVSRYLGPIKFGEFSVGFSLVLILVRINDLGLGATIAKFAAETKNNKVQNEIFNFTISIKLILAVIISVVGWIIAPAISQIMNFSSVNIIRAAFLISCATVFYEQMLVMLQSLHLFSQAVVANLIQATIKLIALGSLVLFKSQQAINFFIAYAASPIFVWLFWKKLLNNKFIPAFNLKVTAVTSRVIQMGKHTAVNLVSGGIIENVDILFVQLYLSTFETGLLGGVNRIAMIFALIAYSLGNVLNPRAARYKLKQDLSKYLKKSALLALASILIFIAFLPFARISILLTIGAEYLAGLNILLILVAAQCLAIASIPFISTFYTFNKNWFFSISGILQLTIVVLGNYLFVPLYGLQAAALVRLATRAALFAVSLYFALHSYKKQYAEEA